MRIRVALIVAALALAPSLAHADEESMSTEADARFKEGVAFAKQGRYEEARAKYIEVLALAPTSKILLNLAVVEEASGHPREALLHAKQYIASPNADPAKVATVKRDLIPELMGKTAHLRIKADAGQDIAVDAEHFKAPLADTVDVAPGAHAVEVAGKRSTFEVAAGSERAFDFSTALPRRNDPIVVGESSGRASMTIAGVASLSLAAIGAGLSIGFGVGAANKNSDADILSAQLGASSTVCAASSDPRCVALLAARSDARTFTGAAVGSGIAGAVFLVGGIILLVVRPKAPLVAAGLSSLALGFSF